MKDRESEREEGERKGGKGDREKVKERESE